MGHRKPNMPFAASAQALGAMFLDTDPQADPAAAANTADLAALLANYGHAAYPIGAIAAGFDYAATLLQGRPLHSLDAEGRRKVLALLEKIPLSRQPLWVSSLLYKLSYLFNPETQRRVGIRYGGIEPPRQGENTRWLAQLQRAADTAADMEIEAEVIVIGSGAGGAAAAYELASRGIAVAIVEAGDHYHRKHFDGRYLEAFKKIYRFTPALGNGVVTIMSGKSVGGSTTINSGTCFRTPDEVLRNWQSSGLRAFTTEQMAPYFAGVEDMLSVSEATRDTVGPLFDVVKRGAEKIGLDDVHCLHRNAPGCDGQALCAYGCPTAAKRSTDVSYIPAALDAGAFLYAGFKVDQLLRDGSRVEGITAHGRRADGTTLRLRINAPNVVVAMGTLHTPVFLMEQGIKNPHLGRHLTIHPTGLVGGVFPGVEFKNDRSIPQGVGSGGMAHEGIRFEGATPPFTVYGVGTHANGREFREVIDAYPNTAFLGFMVSDKSEGRVWRNVGGMPLVTYWVNKTDLQRYAKAMSTVARLFFKAGATKANLFTCHRDPILHSEKELDQFDRRRLNAFDFNMTAYHPLGTARLGTSAETGVCDSDHRVYGIDGLYVMDGSVIPSSLGVNPQVTIMAMASRAAVGLADRLAAPITPSKVAV